MIPAQSPEPRALVVGAGGMLGSKLGVRLGSGAVSLAHAELDICDREAVLEAVRRLTPPVIINAAAYTDVDGCEANEQYAMDVNARGPANLAAACEELDALLVHVSTDFVFDGRSRRPYLPDDLPGPLSAYGRSKLAGEMAVRGRGCQSLIVRTSWLFGAGGKNFVDTILRRAEGGAPLRVVSDQVGRPTLTDDLAEAITRLIDCKARGIVHFANAGQCSWHEFAEAIVHAAGYSIPVEPIRSADLHRAAARPAYSVLDCSLYTQITGAHPRPWQDALQDFLVERTRPSDA